MSYNGSGTFLINSVGQPVVPNTTITTTAFNALTADLASGLTTAMTKDGQTVPTANIPMGGFKLTGLGAGTSATDAAQFGQLQNAPVATLITVAGADTITGTLVQTLTAYATGQQFSFVAAGTNTTAVTLNIDGLGAKAVTRTGAVALAAGALVSGQMAIVEYDGTRFQLINANAFTNLTVSGALTVGTTLAVTGVATLTAQPILSSLTASLPVFSDASKGLVSNAMSGTGSVMMSASPTTTGTLTAAAINASGLVAMAGAATVGTTLGVTGAATFSAGITGSTTLTLSRAGNLNLVTKGYFSSTYDTGTLWQWGPGTVSTGNNFGFTAAAANVLDLLQTQVRSYVAVQMDSTLGVTGTSTMAAINASGPLNQSCASISDWAATFQNTGSTDANGLYVNLGASATGVPFRVDKNGSALLTVSNAGAVTIPGTLGVTGIATSNQYIHAMQNTATPAGGTNNAGFLIGSGGLAILFGSGAPTCGATKGTLYLRTDGTGANDRMYVNTSNSSTWTAVVTVG